MDQVETIRKGERDYKQIFGRTGPLVYPGGHVFLHWALYRLTDGGRNIALCQVIFTAVQLATSFFVTRLYWRFTSQPFLLAVSLLTTVRCRNVFVNGLFNDCWVMMLVFAALWLGLVRNRWMLALLSYSAAVSTKMSALLFAPGMAIIAYCCLGSLTSLVVHSLPAAFLQVSVALPFLLRHPLSYLHRSFEFDRQFFHFLSHNLKWLPKEIFFSPTFQLAMLAAHVFLLLVMCVRFKWFSTPPTSKQDLLAIVFTSNFIGIAFSRSLHYSFYSWYFHTLPLLVFRARWPILLRYGFLLVVELCWNVWTPYHGDDQDGTCASPKATFILTCCHIVLLLSILVRERPIWLDHRKEKKALD